MDQLGAPLVPVDLRSACRQYAAANYYQSCTSDERGTKLEPPEIRN